MFFSCLSSLYLDYRLSSGLTAYQTCCYVEKLQRSYTWCLRINTTTTTRFNAQNGAVAAWHCSFALLMEGTVQSSFPNYGYTVFCKSYQVLHTSIFSTHRNFLTFPVEEARNLLQALSPLFALKFNFLLLLFFSSLIFVAARRCFCHNPAFSLFA